MGLLDIIINAKIDMKKQLNDLLPYLTPRHQPYGKTAAGGGADYFDFINPNNSGRLNIILTALFRNQNRACYWYAYIYPGLSPTGDARICKPINQTDTFMMASMFEDLPEYFVLPPDYMIRFFPANPFPTAGDLIFGDVNFIEVML